MYLCTYSQPVCVTVCNYRHVMSILPPIMLVKGWYRLFGTLREPETARDETEECQIKNDPRSCERNFCNCVISLKKKNSGLQREIWKRAKDFSSTQRFRSLNSKDSSRLYQRCSITRLDRKRSLGR